jgi:hypothetical protein
VLSRTSGRIVGDGALCQSVSCNSVNSREPCLIGVGEYIAESSSPLADIFDMFEVFVSSFVRMFVPDLSSPESPPFSLSGDRDAFAFFSSFNRLSSPSTLFKSASRTSVFGPRFLGTASAGRVSS